MLSRKPLAWQIVGFFVALLVVIAVAVAALVHWANTEQITREVERELAAAERVVKRQLANQRDQLESTAEVLADDYGFREALASGDSETILSALENHSARIEAAMSAMWTPDGQLIAVVDGSDADTSAAEPFESLLAEARQAGAGRSSGLVVSRGRVLQVVVVPVRAPLVVAWVALGFAIDELRTDELGALTGLGVSVAARRADGGWLITGCSLEDGAHKAIDALLGQVALPWLGEAPAGYLTRVVPAVDGDADGGSALVLSRHLGTAFAPYHALQRKLAAIALASVLLFGAGSVWVAGRVTRPLAELTRVARRIQQGGQATPVVVAGSSETRTLTVSFNSMVLALGEREQRVRQLAYEDQLTGLPNRAAFSEALTAGMTDMAAARRPLALIVLDIDRFAGVNDSLGYAVGDEVLRSVAERLRSALERRDFLARIGPDVFAVILREADAHQAEWVIKRIQSAMHEPLMIDGQPLDAVLSMGYAVTPEDGDAPVALQRAAELAKQAAKRQGGHFVRFTPHLDRSRKEHLSLIGELRRAMEQGQLELHYQPKVDLHSGNVTEAEALVRWRHPERGMVSPADFIPFAEQTGYIKALTRWVIEEAVRQSGLWQAEGIDVRISVNISVRDLTEQDLVGLLATLLGRYGVLPERICLEVTETGVMDDTRQAIEVLNALRQLGLRLAIDDFGTGYSSLAYLKRLPVSELKVDQAFVRLLASQMDDALIVRSTIDLGHNLGLEVTAEGVEDEASLALLRQWGCDLAQGYFMSRPLAPAAFADWFHERAGRFALPVGADAGRYTPSRHALAAPG